MLLTLDENRAVFTVDYGRRSHTGDVTILEIVEGPIEFVDTRNNKRTGKVYIKPVQTVAGGIAFGRPYSAPFSVR
jgi:dihydroorotase